MNYSTLLLAKHEAKHENGETKQASPQMGEEECGSRNPTCSLLICYNSFLLLPLLLLFFNPKRSLEQSVEGEKKKRESYGFLGLDFSKFRQHFHCTCHKKEKSASMYCLKYDRKDNAKNKN